MSIPGVESARRRRASHSRPSLTPPCPSRHLPHHHRHLFPSVSSLLAPLALSQLDCFDVERRSVRPGSALALPRDDGLVMAARNRLDERLRAPFHVSRRQTGSPPSEAHVRRGRDAAEGGKAFRKIGDLQSRLHLERNEEKQEECPVCLERFMLSEIVMDLPCHHKFHSQCLIPWLESHWECPCCRAHVSHSHVGIRPLELAARI